MYRLLKSKRKYFDINQTKMAEILGISLVAYNQKENGKIRFNQDEMRLISNMFKLSVDDLFFEKEVVETRIIIT